MFEGVASEFCDGAGHFDTCRAGADDDECEVFLSLVWIIEAFGVFECGEDAGADFGGFLDGFEAGCVLAPMIVSEVGMGYTGCEDE